MITVSALCRTVVEIGFLRGAAGAPDRDLNRHPTRRCITPILACSRDFPPLSFSPPVRALPAPGRTGLEPAVAVPGSFLIMVHSTELPRSQEERSKTAEILQFTITHPVVAGASFTSRGKKSRHLARATVPRVIRPCPCHATPVTTIYFGITLTAYLHWKSLSSQVTLCRTRPLLFSPFWVKGSSLFPFLGFWGKRRWSRRRTGPSLFPQ